MFAGSTVRLRTDEKEIIFNHPKEELSLDHVRSISRVSSLPDCYRLMCFGNREEILVSWTATCLEISSSFILIAI